MISDEILIGKCDSLSNVIFILIADLEGSLSSGVLFFVSTKYLESHCLWLHVWKHE